MPLLPKRHAAWSERSLERKFAFSPIQEKLYGNLGSTMPKSVESRERSSKRGDGDDAVARARATVLDGVGREVAASFPGITRLGGQIVAALYLADEPLSMDVLSEELGRSKSNIFANLRGLEAAGIVERRRSPGSRYDAFVLRGKYPDIIVGAYLSRLRRVVVDKVNLCTRALEILGDSTGDEADAMRAKLGSLQQKYERFAAVFELIPIGDGPIDLEEVLDGLPPDILETVAAMAKRALGLGPRPLHERKVAAGRKG
jgi:DNA-binding transcriptional regulator GbsR (MarR family)